MGIFDRFKAVRTVERVVYLKDTINGMTASQLYESQPALRSVISFLAEEVASLPLKCYVMQEDGGRERDRDSVLAKVLKNPNSHDTAYDLVLATVSEYLLHDDCFWLSIPANTETGWIVEVLPRDWLKPLSDNGFELTDIKVTTSYGARTTLSPDDVIRFAGWSPMGAASSACRINALKDILTEQISAWQFRNGIWKNQGRVTQWISRPADTPWSDGARDRFANSWKEKFAGNKGTDTGGTPLLEDGMRLETIPFNSREAQWVEATKLSREDVCAVYHLNPAHLYHSDGQSYASVKENARALYADTLSPILTMISQRINSYLVPKLGLDDRHYCEFDLDAKLQGSFEERASVMQSAVGAPWMTRNEARAKLNLPAVEGGDELVTPLNVLIGGQSSPNDVDGVESPYNSGNPSKKSNGVRMKSAPGKTDSKEIAEALRKFFQRQARSIEPRLKAKSDNYPEWWDAERWERELADDLRPIFQKQAVKRGQQAADAAHLGEFDGSEIEAYIAAMAKGKSKAINNVTYRQLMEALDGDMEEDALGSTVSGVFEKAEETRADVSGKSFATAIAGFAILEAVRQLAPQRQAMKTWIVTSANPRSSHIMLDGETVPYDGEFSNGAKFPGDQVLTPDESCGCQCQVEIYIP